MSNTTREPSFEGDGPIAAAETVLRDRRELALVAVERTRMPMVITDPKQDDSPIVLANHAFLELSGYSASEIIGRNCRFLQGPQTDPAAVETIRQGLAANRGTVTVELLNYRRDGSAFWNQLEISAVRDGSGDTIYHFASQKDVSARRQSQAMEATERLLLKEVDHRALNALTLVQSIVRLTRRDTAEAYSRAVTGRVDALAHAHQLLAESGWSGAALDRVAARELDAPSSLKFEGPPVRLPPRLVQPIALILHELATNAEEHGASVRAGSNAGAPAILVWQPCMNTLRLAWTEQSRRAGAGVPPAGFGLNLIRAVVERQLEGRVDMRWSAAKFEVEIVLPWSTAEAEWARCVAL